KTDAAQDTVMAEKPKKVLSLIEEDKPKVPRVRKLASLENPVLPRIKALEPTPVPEPEPAPVSVEAEPTAATTPGEKVLHLKPPFTVKDLAAGIGLKPFVVIKDLMDLGIFANQNQSLEPDIASKVCDLHGW